MGKQRESIDEELRAWLTRQPMFFVGTAPLAADGHVNLSPKGLDTLRVLGPRRLAWLDLTGSGAETIAHLRENGRIVIMLCAFEGAPRIVRLHGTGRVVCPGAGDWDGLRPLFPDYPGARTIIDVGVTRIGDSCGFGVPTFSSVAQRDSLPRWAAGKGPGALEAYRRERNRRSIDGLPSIGADAPAQSLLEGD